MSVFSASILPVSARPPRASSLAVFTRRRRDGRPPRYPTSYLAPLDPFSSCVTLSPYSTLFRHVPPLSLCRSLLQSPLTRWPPRCFSASVRVRPRPSVGPFCHFPCVGLRPRACRGLPPALDSAPGAQTRQQFSSAKLRITISIFKYVPSNVEKAYIFAILA